MAYSNAQFLAKIKDSVIMDAKRSGILASLTAAQALIESGSGNSGLTQKANNLFGIKGEYNGQYVTMKTQEWSPSKGYYTVEAKFRKYPSWEASISDHTDFLLRNSRYKNLIGVKDYKVACQLIHQDGYATSPTYAQALIKTIETHRLYEWDGAPEPVPEPIDPYAGIVTASALRVRTGPGTNYAVKQSGGQQLMLPKGMVIAICEHCNGWGRISDISGWVSLEYITK